MQLGQVLPDHVPHHDHFAEYGPSFQMEVDSSKSHTVCQMRRKLTQRVGNAVDQNTESSLVEARNSFQAIAGRIETIVGGG